MFNIFGKLQKNLELTKDYVIQETVTPVTSSIKHALYSLVWGIFLVLFLLFFTLGSLRLAQENLKDDLSSIPYFLAFLVLLLAAALVWKIVTKLPVGLREKETNE